MIAKIRNDPTILALAVTGLILAVAIASVLVAYGRTVAQALTFPYPLDYSEGPSLDETLRLASGEAIYRTSITTPPYTITNDPPLFMLLQAPLTRLFGPAFWYGRGISILSLLATALFLALTLYQLSKDWLAAAIAGLLLFTVPYFMHWSVLDQSDSLGLALTWAGLYAVVRWAGRGQVPSTGKWLAHDWQLGLSGLLFTAAIYTREIFLIAGPLSALAWLVMSKRYRQAAAFLAFTVGAVLIVAIALNIFTQGGFYYNMVTTNVNYWNAQLAFAKFIELSFHAFFLILIALIFFIGERLGNPTSTWPFALAFLLASLLGTIVFGKADLNDGSMFGLTSALCLVSGVGIAWATNHWAKSLLLVLLALQVGYLGSWFSLDYQPGFDDKIGSRGDIEKMAEIIRQANGPVLIDEYMGLLPLAGQPIYYEPYEFNQLSQAGLWNPALLIKAVQANQFPVIMIYFPTNFYITKMRWSDALYTTIWDDYNHSTTSIADMLIFYPKK